LNRDPIRRLGAGEADAEDIKKHPFFRDINFDDVYNKKIPPMYFPQIVSSTRFNKAPNVRLRDSIHTSIHRVILRMSPVS
jgi:hypothetical protein